MIDAAVILLYAADHMPWAGLVVILVRDAGLVVGYYVLAPRGYELDVNLLGKAATWVLYVAVGCLLVTHRSTEWPLWVFWVGLATALAAAALYVVGAGRKVKR
jgi:phosphatidylglycerophosphate synthase